MKNIKIDFIRVWDGVSLFLFMTFPHSIIFSFVFLKEITYIMPFLGILVHATKLTQSRRNIASSINNVFGVAANISFILLRNGITLTNSIPNFAPNIFIQMLPTAILLILSMSISSKENHI
jgi:hypothetical protein